MIIEAIGQYFPTIIIYSILVINCVHYAENNYYEIDTLQIEAGHVIGAATQDNTAVIIASEIPTDPRDPRILYQAKRNGWSRYLPDMSEELVYRLKAVGADYLAIIATQENIKNVYGYDFNVYHLTEQPWKVLVKDLSEFP